MTDTTAVNPIDHFLTTAWEALSTSQIINSAPAQLIGGIVLIFTAIALIGFVSGFASLEITDKEKS